MTQGAALAISLAVGLGFGFWVGSIAKSKGRSFGWGFVSGFLFHIIALIVVSAMRPLTADSPPRRPGIHQQMREANEVQRKVREEYRARKKAERENR